MNSNSFPCFRSFIYIYYSYIISIKLEYFFMEKIPMWLTPSFLLHTGEGENNVKG